MSSKSIELPNDTITFRAIICKQKRINCPQRLNIHEGDYVECTIKILERNSKGA